jgi:glycosyltransferase involved in cell wall biosynthesis
MKVLLVDPSLYTAPYDAALSQGLRDNDVSPFWATRALRPGEQEYLPPGEVIPLFYRWTDGGNRREGKLWKVAKAAEHGRDLLRLLRLVEGGPYEVVHFQWSAIPSLDARVMAAIRRQRPVILTVHDTIPHNGVNISAVQRRGFRELLSAPDHLIVHTRTAFDSLTGQGVSPEKISIIPHGPLLPKAAARAVERGKRWRVLMFGRIQTYKGLDVLIEALGMIPPSQREAIEVTVAGEPMMATDHFEARASQLGLEPPFLQFRLYRHSEQEMADLLASADCFVFPYRAIEASGVLYLVAAYSKWMIASALGAFVDVIDDGRGELIEPGNPQVLAQAIAASVGRVPATTGEHQISSWSAIGLETRRLYERMLAKGGGATDGAGYVPPASAVVDAPRAGQTTSVTRTAMIDASMK